MNSRLWVARRDPGLKARIIDSFPLCDESGAFVRAGSSLLRIGSRLLAIQDDAWQAWWIDPQRRRLTPLRLKGSGKRKSKKKKPDLEAAFVDRNGAIWILGSGSRPNRCRIARIALGKAPRVTVHEAAPLYRALAEALGTAPNIEGALVWRKQLRLFHRDTGGSASAMVDLPLEVLKGKKVRVLALTRCELGNLSSVPLGFTDATRFGSSMIYLAAAEYSRDAIADGPVAGAALGVIGRNGARWTSLRERDGQLSRRKVEGIVLDAGGKSGWLLTDPDDPAQPAELCRVDLRGFE